MIGVSLTEPKSVIHNELKSVACPDLNTRGGLAPSCIGVIMVHVVRRKFLNYYLFIRGVVDVATYVTYIMVYY